MSLKQELITVKTLVEVILEIDYRARCSDSYLYLRVIRILAIGTEIDLNKITVPYFLENMEDMKFPAFETVRRTRQKVQAEHPEFAADNFTREKRAENEAVYNAFAKEGA